MYVCIHTCMYICRYAWVYIRLYVCMYVCVCMSCMYACVYTRMYVCMYVGRETFFSGFWCTHFRCTFVFCALTTHINANSDASPVIRICMVIILLVVSMRV
jgi:hypothetical protein